MKNKNIKLRLTPEKQHTLLHALNGFRNFLISEGRYTDLTDEVIVQIMGTPVKKVKIAR